MEWKKNVNKGVRCFRSSTQWKDKGGVNGRDLDEERLV